MNMIYQNKIHNVELELSSSCNSWCPSCPRFHMDNHTMYFNIHAALNQQLTKDQLIQIINETVEEPIIDIIGTVGDSMAHNDIEDMLNVIAQLRPRSTLSLHTNGGLKMPDLYSRIAPLFSKDKKWKMVFSIDGLEDTNSIYRNRVEWTRVMKNAQAFIDAGGVADWKCVDFDHIQHQKEHIQKLSERMGFNTCYFSENQDGAGELEKVIRANGPDIVTDREHPEAREIIVKPLKFIEVSGIEPKCEIDQYIHIRADGKVFPCCMIAAHAVDTNRSIRNSVEDHMQLSSGWNDLNNHSFSEILSNEKWKQVKSGYTDNPCWSCTHSCGIESDTPNKAPINSK